jgi:hypothetical protein
MNQEMKFFEADDIGPTSGLEGTKKLLLYYKHYYIVITEDKKDVVAKRNQVTVYDWRDRRNKFIAYQGNVHARVPGKRTVFFFFFFFFFFFCFFPRALRCSRECLVNGVCC